MIIPITVIKIAVAIIIFIVGFIIGYVFCDKTTKYSENDR